MRRASLILLLLSIVSITSAQNKFRICIEKGESYSYYQRGDAPTKRGKITVSQTQKSKDAGFEVEIAESEIKVDIPDGIKRECNVLKSEYHSTTPLGEKNRLTVTLTYKSERQMRIKMAANVRPNSKSGSEPLVSIGTGAVILPPTGGRYKSIALPLAKMQGDVKSVLYTLFTICGTKEWKATTLSIKSIEYSN